VWAAEVAADDVRLSLPSAEEAAGLGGEFGLVPGPVLSGQAVLEVGVDQLVGVQLRRVRRKEVQLDVVGVGGEPVATFQEQWAACPSTTRWTLWSKWPARRFRKRHITSAVKLSVKTMKCIRPQVLIADITFTENRFPLRPTTGVFPFSPQVRPVTRSERTPTWSAKRISPPSFFAFARICGQVSSCQRPTACGSCSTALLSGR
jgi:hypothetical protein